MTASPELLAAVEVFRALGWDQADLRDVLNLPLGTPEQQRAALAGLRKGDWSGWKQNPQKPQGWPQSVSWIDVDPLMLMCFAIRLGTSSRRTLQLASTRYLTNSSVSEIVSRLLAERGREFVQRLVPAAARSDDLTAEILTPLVVQFDLPVPESKRYLERWSRCAHTALGLSPSFHAQSLDLALIGARYTDHVRVAVQLDAGTQPLTGTLEPAVERGWISRDEAIDLAFTALDLTKRPGYRVDWARAIITDLHLTDTELQARADELISSMTFGDPLIIEAFAPRLIQLIDDDLLVDLLEVALPIKTKKARLTVLAATAKRITPGPEAISALEAQLLEIAASRDNALARAAQKIITAWNIDRAEEPPTPAALATCGRWQPTPPLWTVPRFDLGDVTPQALTAAAGVLLARDAWSTVHIDVASERFIALANAVERHNVDGARAALSGLSDHWNRETNVAHAWVSENHNWLTQAREHALSLGARDADVFERLGQVPCLLSMPSWIDLRIDPADLTNRLAEYHRDAIPVSETDLYLALARTDFTRQTEPLRARLAELTVPVVRHDGTFSAEPAGAIILRYADDPIPEPAVNLNEKSGQWRAELAAAPDSLKTFSGGVAGGHINMLVEHYPVWDNASAWAIQWRKKSDQGIMLRQLVCRAQPLRPAMAMNLIAAQRGFHDAAAADGTTAILEAWNRGLLRPGVADVRYLDWSAGQPAQLAALAKACLELAGEGLLSVVWPVLDDLIVASLAGTRLSAGVAETADAVRSLATEVRAAVDAGLAPRESLDVPGTRTLAARPGTSKAVTAAREALALLGAPTSVPDATDTAPAEAVLDFDVIWPQDAGQLPAVIDDAVISAVWLDPSAQQKTLALDITLPAAPGRPAERVRRFNHWSFALLENGQCNVQPYSEDAPPTDRWDYVGTAWLRWDVELQRLVVEEENNRSIPEPPLSTTLVAILLAASCDDAATHDQIRDLLTQNLCGSAAVAVATRALLPSHAFSPARLAGFIERTPTTLAYLWPVLVESIRYASETNGPVPRWLNRVLDVTSWYWPTLTEAARLGKIPASSATWPGLSELAQRKGTSAALVKARALAARLGTPS